jgi:hypothetical protein
MTGAALSWPAAGEAHAVGGGSPLPGAYPSGELGWSSSDMLLLNGLRPVEKLMAFGRRVGDEGDEETRRVVGFWCMLQACVSRVSDVSSGCCKCFVWMLQK